MKRKIWLVVGFLAVPALLMVACGPTTSVPEGDVTGIQESLVEYPKNADGYADIDAEQLAGVLENKDFTLVNVHIPYEGEIPQTDLFIPFDQVADYQDQLPEKDAPIVLYCRSGSMSTSAARDLVALGYTNVLEVDGGFSAWQASGHELLHNR